MARPSKPTAVIRAENKSHRTKAELETRKKGEAAMLSGAPLLETSGVKKNKIAHKEFTRVVKLMRAIGKDDALYSAGINTYCELYAEIAALEVEKQRIESIADELQDKFDALEVTEYEDILSFTKALTRLVSTKHGISSEIDQKRRMRLAIDKENVMTISAALRSIPKTPEKAENPLFTALSQVTEEEDESPNED